jgi:hypothetical protein
VYPKVSAYNNKHSLRSNIKDYGGKTHYNDSQNIDTTARSGRELYHLQFSLPAASPETIGYTLLHIFLSVFTSSRMRWTTDVARMGEMRNAYKVLVGKPEGKRIRKTHVEWEDNIVIDLRETGWEGVDWINLDQDRDKWRTVVSTVMSLPIP